MTLKFNSADVAKAADEWGFNCGPGALCAILGMSPDEIRPHLLDFEKKRYTNPTLMRDILRGMGLKWERVFECLGANQAATPVYPNFGLVRIQWDGPWCKEGVPVAARYRHTHWIAVRPPTIWGQRYPDNPRDVFDVNCIHGNGWCPWDGWKDEVVPWILDGSKANGEWWPTHCWEVHL